MLSSTALIPSRCNIVFRYDTRHLGPALGEEDKKGIQSASSSRDLARDPLLTTLAAFPFPPVRDPG